MNVANHPASVARPSVTETIATARENIRDKSFVAVADCIDTLLDCYNAAALPNVKSEISELIPQFSNGNLRRTQEFVRALDQIEFSMLVPEESE